MAGSNLKDTLYGGVAVVHVPGLQGPKGEDAVVTPSMQKLHDEAIAAATTAESARIAAQTAEQHAVEVGADIDSDRVVTEEAASKAIASAQSSESSATAASRYADIVMENKTALDVVAANKTAFTSTVTHVNDVITISEHIDEVHTVGQDLQGVNADSLDLGSVADSIDQITTVTDGYIKKVAEHIDDCVHPVSLHLDAIETVAGEISSIASKLSLSGGTMTGDITMSGNRQITSGTSGGGRVYIGTTSLSLESNNTGYENGAGLLLRSSTYANAQKGHFYLYAGTSSSNRVTLEGDPDTKKLTWNSKEVLTGEISASQLADTIDLGSM